MKKFEYGVFHLGVGHPLKDTLNKFGEEGWELVYLRLGDSADEHCFGYFKRELIDEKLSESSS